METTHSHNSNLIVLPGVFLLVYLKSFTFLNIVPHRDTIMPGSSSSLFYLNPNRCRRCTQMKNTWGLTQQYFSWKYIFRWCRKALFPLADVSDCTDLELEATWELFCHSDTFKLQWTNGCPTQSRRFWRVKQASKHQEQYYFNHFKSY